MSTNPHLIDGEFQSDKYPTTPRGKVPFSCADPMAQDLLWEYARRRRVVDAEFSDALETALKLAGYEPPVSFEHGGEAVMEHDAVVIRVPIVNIAHALEGGWASGHMDVRYKVTDAATFAKEWLRALNREEEDGTTPIHHMLDKTLFDAIDQGAEGVEEHEEQEA